MKTLIPFSPILFPVSCAAQLVRIGPELQFKLKLEDPTEQLQYSSHFFDVQASPSDRKDELWKKTCFEVFLRNPETGSYYEFNFSTEKEWNLYRFDSYRKPQPPLRSDDFRIQNLKWRNGEFQAQILNSMNLPEMEVALTAVLLARSGESLYMSLNHPDPKPNFHHHKSFQFKI